MATTDPAARLLNHVKRFRKFCSQNPGKTLADAWVDTLRCKSDAPVEIYTQLAKLLALANEVEEIIKTNHPDDHDLYLSTFGRLKEGLVPRRLGVQIRSSKDTFDGEIEARLEFCSTALSKEIVIEPATLAELKLSIDELFDSIKTASIPSHLRRTLLNLVAAMRRAVEEYEINGLRGLKQAFGELCVEMRIHQKEFSQSPPSPWKDAVVKVYGNLSAAIQFALTTENAIIALPAAAEVIGQVTGR